jgi:DNA-binding response OmpR family regulator
VRILVVEDERKIAKALKEGLEGEGYEVAVTHAANDAFFRITTENFDLVILDLTLPDRDGLEILQNFRKLGLEIRVLVLTARATLQDRLDGLNAGADDYLTKPFAFAEFLARVRALLRRGRPAGLLSLETANLTMDLSTRRVSRGGRNLELTGKEFELLEYLLRNQGDVVLRETLARDVWKDSDASTTLNNVIDVHIARLRRKIDGDHEVKLIHTIRGAGFMLSDKDPHVLRVASDTGGM